MSFCETCENLKKLLTFTKDLRVIMFNCQTGFSKTNETLYSHCEEGF